MNLIRYLLSKKKKMKIINIQAKDEEKNYKKNIVRKT